MKQRKLRILVDMDNTMVDYDTPMAQALSDEHPHLNITAENWPLIKDEY